MLPKGGVIKRYSGIMVATCVVQIRVAHGGSECCDALCGEIGEVIMHLLQTRYGVQFGIDTRDFSAVCLVPKTQHGWQSDLSFPLL